MKKSWLILILVAFLPLAAGMDCDLIMGGGYGGGYGYGGYGGGYGYGGYGGGYGGGYDHYDDYYYDDYYYDDYWF